MIASDAHGKNHHQVGSFAAHVEYLDLALGDGNIVRCSPHAHPALGRSVVMLGEHARLVQLSPAELRQPLRRPSRSARTLPIDSPNFALNGRWVRLFNAAYNHAQRDGTRLVDLEPYFDPLDALLNWNRMYGARGFLQYQCAVPTESGPDALRELLNTISVAGIGCFLAVLKKLGRQNPGHLSFPMPG
jgi:FAD/FMN-containing dehydrogenase